MVAETTFAAVAFHPECLRTSSVLASGQDDFNITVTWSVVAAKLNISAGHIEGGLGSLRHLMPEGISQVVTDPLIELFFGLRIMGTAIQREWILEDRVRGETCCFGLCVVNDGVPFVLCP